ncbi:MAG: heme-binding protein [Pseudolabrys sp.]|nr:heme-binding protein [Pseudolabrys sp.]
MSKTMFVAAGFATLALAQPAAAELLTHKDLTADMAVTMAQTAVNTCKAQGQNVSATVVGRAGEVIVQIRGDGAGMHTFENSFRKAWTARSFKAPSGAIEDRLKANPNLPLIHLTNVIADKGGLPIKVGDDTIGALGVSGCPGCDEPCTQAGIDKVSGELK